MITLVDVVVRNNEQKAKKYAEALLRLREALSAFESVAEAESERDLVWTNHYGYLRMAFDKLRRVAKEYITDGVGLPKRWQLRAERNDFKVVHQYQKGDLVHDRSGKVYQVTKVMLDGRLAIEPIGTDEG